MRVSSATKVSHDALTFVKGLAALQSGATSPLPHLLFLRESTNATALKPAARAPATAGHLMLASIAMPSLLMAYAADAAPRAAGLALMRCLGCVGAGNL